MYNDNDIPIRKNSPLLLLLLLPNYSPLLTLTFSPSLPLLLLCDSSTC